MVTVVTSMPLRAHSRIAATSTTPKKSRRTRTPPQPGMSPNSAASRYPWSREISCTHSSHRDADDREHLDRVYGTLEPNAANAESPLHASDECVFQEVRESSPYDRDDRRVLQLLQESQVTRWKDSSDGCRS